MSLNPPSLELVVSNLLFVKKHERSLHVTNRQLFSINAVLVRLENVTSNNVKGSNKRVTTTHMMLVVNQLDDVCQRKISWWYKSRSRCIQVGENSQ